MKTEILTACDRLVAGAANGMYQGILVAAIVALSLRVLGRTNAATRHAVWFCTLLLLASLMVAQCVGDYSAWANPTSKSADAAAAPAREPALDLAPSIAVATPETDDLSEDAAVASGLTAQGATRGQVESEPNSVRPSGIMELASGLAGCVPDHLRLANRR